MSTLVAGVGNILLGDDGFGVQVARHLRRTGPPPRVTVADYGTSGLHLAFDLCSGGYSTVVLVDALGRGYEPGTVSLVDLTDVRAPSEVDAHGMRPDVVLDLVDTLGGHLDRVLLVGCEPASVDHQVGLSPPVAAAVEPAARLVRSVISGQSEIGGAPETDSPPETTVRRIEIRQEE
ncbi:hydrogenase maturation protease [Frankia sp. Mgl5]|uniref:hydrogenase maturation protease n=1 Tax=Frankia sp. Mgl5 TaxID=2933793 RepID=UPI00200C1FA2|nr:hydrogenase maturation protease [Frankia sp. Mgl5]MCK9926781.1 hydrogenase maturation protease [Frankia sp. Mgl5]